jgi:hypothetical protein
MKKEIKLLQKIIPLLSLAMLVPVIASAAVSGPCGMLDGVNGILCKIHEILSSVLPVLIALGVVYFVWGIVQYVIGDTDEAKTKGRDKMIFGVIGLAVIISVWGIVYIITTTFGIEEVAPSGGYLQNLLPR